MAYYAEINRAINEWHGNNTNPPLSIANLNQKEIHDLQLVGNWDAIADRFVDAAHSLKHTGVDTGSAKRSWCECQDHLSFSVAD